MLVAGIAAACVALYELSEARARASGWGWRWGEIADELVKTPLYYAAHGLQIALLTSAGMVALLRRWRGLSARYLVAFLLLQAAGALMSARGLTLDDILSVRIADSTGPFVTLISLVAFATVEPKEARLVGWVLSVLGLVVSTMVAIGLLGLRTAHREEVVSSLQNYLNVLYWLAAWMLLGVGGERRWLRGLRWLPLLVYVAGSVIVQTRLNLLMACLLLIARVYLSHRTAGVAAVALTVAGGALAFALAVGPWLFQDTPFTDLVGEALGALGGRLTQDTRTGQIVAFFADVSPYELILGRGSRATWNWPGMNAQWAGGTDVGYLSLLFFGGIPLLATYVAFHLAPAWGILRSSRRGPELAPAIIVALWAVRTLSSSFPSYSLDYYVVLFSLGICLGRTGRDGRRPRPFDAPRT
jgi:hypothetical protein